MVTDDERLEAAERAIEQLKVLKLANSTLARDQVLMFEELNKCKQEAANERILSQEIVAEREELYAKCEEQEMRYQKFLADAVRGIKARDTTINRLMKKLEVSEKGAKRNS